MTTMKTIKALDALATQVRAYQNILQRLATLHKEDRAPEEETYDDTESAYSNGLDVGAYGAYQEVREIARMALR